MTLIKSISGIRGTIGATQGNNLTPIDIVKFTAAYALILNEKYPSQNLYVVVGRDARVSGEMVNHLVCGTLISMGVNVLDIGLSTTPTVEMEVLYQKANGGLILTASHNPAQWNALKLLDDNGEFFSAQLGQKVLDKAEQIDDIQFCSYDKMGTYQQVDNAIDRHIQAVKRLPIVDCNAIVNANFSVAVDCVNSTGGIAIPKLLKALGVQTIHELNCTPNGIFPHNPEPLPEHLTDISEFIKTHKVDVGFVVDPDVDRLAIMQENGECFGEEYTLVAVTDYILNQQKGNTVSNLSSSQALKDITLQHGGQYFAAAVGEVNVVQKMKECQAIIGGEGNGGVIYPQLHYGRDALVGIALFLTSLAKRNCTCSHLRQSFPNYFIYKDRMQLTPNINVDKILEKMKQLYSNNEIIDIDGVKIIFPHEWVHLRKSNTEPIIRIYAESKDMEAAKNLANTIKEHISKCIDK